MNISRIDTDRNSDHPDYETTVTVWIDGAEYPAVRYVEDSRGWFIEQIIDEDGVVDDLPTGSFDEYVLESIAILSSAMYEGRCGGWTMKMLAGKKGPSPTNVEYERY